MAERDDDWTVGYFDDVYLELFPFPEAGQTDEEVAALAHLLPSPPAHVLDLACGQGRHAVRASRNAGTKSSASTPRGSFWRMRDGRPTSSV